MEPANELCYYTLKNVPLNADELHQEGGIELIASVMTRCFEQVTTNSKDAETHVKIATNCMLTFFVATQLKECRARVLKLPLVPHLAAKRIAYEKAPALSRASIFCCEALCSHPELQDRVTQHGALWHLLRFAFRYDYTLEDNGIEATKTNHTQLFANRAAKGALRTIYALCGIRPSPEYLKTKSNGNLFDLLRKLLTPFVVKKMLSVPNGEDEILKLLNSNHETPVYLWNNTSRTELIDLLTRNSDVCLAAGPESENLPPLSADEFEYSSHAKELIVGGVFIRVYNEQPQFSLEEPEAVLRAMMQYFEKKLAKNDFTEFDPVLKALRNVLVSYPRTAGVMEAKMHTLIKTLRATEGTCISEAFETLAKAATFPQCVTACGKIPTTMTEVLLALHRGGEATYKPAAAFLRVVLGDVQCAQQALDRGLYVFLLQMFMTAKKQETKEDCCAAITKANGDSLYGPKMYRLECKFIPAVFIDTMKENPTQACQLFETAQETPELVWNTERRQRALEMCARARASIVETLSSEPLAMWKLPSDLTPPQSADELEVGGVMLSLYVKQPGWTVRKPRDFLAGLMEHITTISGEQRSNVDTFDLLTRSAGLFFTTTPSAADLLISMGYIGKLLKLAETGSDAAVISAVRILHDVFNSKACVESLGALDPITPLAAAMRVCGPESEHFVTLMDTIERLLARSSEKANMVKCAIQTKFFVRVLSMLEGGFTTSPQPAAARAIAVKLIKAAIAAQDPLYGPQLQAILDGSPVWSKYKDQSHDLFLTGPQFGGYLTGGGTRTMLTLTAPPASTMNDSEPPPLD